MPNPMPNPKSREIYARQAAHKAGLTLAISRRKNDAGTIYLIDPKTPAIVLGGPGVDLADVEAYLAKTVR